MSLIVKNRETRNQNANPGTISQFTVFIEEEKYMSITVTKKQYVMYELISGEVWFNVNSSTKFNY